MFAEILAISMHHHLHYYAKANGEDFNLLLVRLAFEFDNARRKKLSKPPLPSATELREVITLLRTFFLPIIEASQQNQTLVVQWTPMTWQK